VKTYDGVELVQRHLAQLLSKYPEGSLSPRDVLITLELEKDPEKQARELNMKLTMAIYTAADEYLKKLPKGQQNFFKFDSEHKSHLDQLTQRVLSTIK